MADEKLWTPANKVTLARILAIPLFIIVVVSPWPDYLPQWPEAEMWKPIIAALVFIAISATDAVDGHLARSRNEVTNLGKFMDPLADKILVAAALLALIEQQVLPSWVALIILAREFIVSGIRMVASSEGVVIAASWWGKVKTVTQIVAVVLFLLKSSPLFGMVSDDLGDWLYLLAWATMLAALFFTIVSMLDYLSKARELLGFSRKATPADVAPYPYMSVEQGDAACEEGAPTEEHLRELAGRAIDAARRRGERIGAAESCTGGLVGAALTSVPGASEVLAGGIVSYSNDVKQARLGVSADTLRLHGAVSAETACEMAQGACEALSADSCVSITGIAGPGGAVAGKPVGTVFIGRCRNGVTIAREFHFKGEREEVRMKAVREALELLARQ